VRKKWSREILGARSARKRDYQGLPTKPESLTFHGRVIFWCRFPYYDVLSLSPVVTNPGRCLEENRSTRQVARRKQSKHAVRRMSLSSETSKEVVKGRPMKEPSCNGSCRVCRCNFKSYYRDFKRRVSTKNFFEIAKRAGVEKCRLADLVTERVFFL
jgi:hypothetical protein